MKSSEGHWLVAGGGWVVREKKNKNGQTEGKRKKIKGHKKDTKEKR